MRGRPNAAQRLAGWLRREWLLALATALAALLALSDPRPPGDYLRWLQAPTLAGLLGLLLAIQLIRDSGLIQRIARLLVQRMHSVRAIGLLLVSASAILSTLLTNDVSLFLLVPVAVAIGKAGGLPTTRLVVLQALAVNAGSTLSPIGNPQNLLLWQASQQSALVFVGRMLPATLVMLGLLLVLTWCWLPRRPLTLDAQALSSASARPPAAIGGMLALGGMVGMIEHGRPGLAVAILVPVCLLLARDSLRRIDWPLLASFAAIFLALGHLADLGVVRQMLGALDFRLPWVAYLTAILSAQLISNVPATVLLQHYVHDPMTLVVAVDVGGFGLAIGSMANLIALRLADVKHGLRQFHRVSLPFLLICGTLVYVVERLHA